MIYHILSHRLRFISLVFVISMLSIQCKCGLGKKNSQTTPKASEIDHQELDRLIKLVRDKTAQDPKLYSLLAVLEKIKKGENLRTTIQNWAGHETPLYDAVTFFDEPALIEQLTKHGFNINIEQAIVISHNRPTLLHRAIEVEHIQVANFLIRHGSNINEQDQKKRTPLHTAIINRRTKALKWLIEQGAELHSPSKTPYLILATQNNYLEGVKLLLENPQIDVNAQDSNGLTALHHAASKGEIGIVNALLGTKKANIYIRTTDLGKDIPLIKAAENGFLEIVSSLIDYDSTPAHLNATDTGGNTAIVVATISNRPAVVQILLDKGADPDILSVNDETALQIAKREKYLEIEKILSEKPK